MVEEILSVFAEIVLSKLGSAAVKQIGLACGLKKKLQKLEEKISTIRNILSDAEKKQTESSAVKEWLGRLKTVIYDADDLLDKVTTEALRKKVETHQSKVREVRDFFTSSNPLLFRYVVGSEIKAILKRLDEIVSEMRDFQFVVKLEERPTEIKRREETSSYVHVPKIVGRDSDKEHLISLLLSSGNEQNVHIIPIVGMGGLGKTTLAQLVYNDKRIQDHFTKKIWVCVSNDFDVKSILIKVLQAVGDDSRINQGIEQVKNHAREVLCKNQFFLVLDDVWNEDLVKWSELQELLITGARESRVVVTTRSGKVASIVRHNIVEPYKLKGLTDTQCLDILLKWAFQKGEESKHQDLVNIATEIVKKCGGVPLAARTLGALLSAETNARYWSSIRDNEMWALVQKENDILPILKLSYDQMPSYLKKCFGYCSLFKKDTVICKYKLIYGWMAHGFLQSSGKNDEILEDIGEKYILELVRRSFLQPEAKKFDNILELEIQSFYTMHDLVHDLAQYVKGNEYMTNIEEAHTETITDRVRHVSFDSNTYFEFSISLAKAKKLRTMFLPERIRKEYGLFFELAISSFKCLRVLEANDEYSLPKNIRKLKHLRFLSFEGVVELPNSLCKLLNLQYLDLSESGISELPRDFGNLVNLRYLFLSSKLRCLPDKCISGLSSLKTLIIVENNELRSLGEGIQHLTGLRKLVIGYCANLEFSDNSFKGLKSLEALTLIDLPILRSLGEGIQHLTGLRELVISDCENLEFSDYSFKGLKSLEVLALEDLPILVTLPKGLKDAADTLTHLAWKEDVKKEERIGRRLPMYPTLKSICSRESWRKLSGLGNNLSIMYEERRPDQVDLKPISLPV